MGKGRKNKRKNFQEYESTRQENENPTNRSFERRRSFQQNGAYRHNQYENHYRSGQNYRNGRNHPYKQTNSRRFPSRPQSPVRGSQEYMEKKIEKTSAIIMQHLLNPNETPPIMEIAPKDTVAPSQNKEIPIESQASTSSNLGNKHKRKRTSKEAEEIHRKIMNQITNLSEGRKKNLIHAENSGYDATIQHFVKQRRLEISRALRSWRSANPTDKPSEDFSSIIPDIGIKIEDLPSEVIEELTYTFDNDFNVEFNSFDFGVIPEEDRCMPPNLDEPPNLYPESQADRSFGDLDMFTNNGSIRTEGENKLFSNVSSTHDDTFNEDIKEYYIEDRLSEYTTLDLELKEEIDDTEEEQNTKNKKDSPDEYAALNNNSAPPPGTANSDDTTISAYAVETMKSAYTGGTNNSACTAEKHINNDLKKLPEKVSSASSNTTHNNAKPGAEDTMEEFLKRHFIGPPKNVAEGLARLSQMEKWTLECSRYRTELLDQLYELMSGEDVPKEIVEVEDNSSIEEISCSDVDEPVEDLLELPEQNEVIVAVKFFENKLVTASEKGFIRIYSLPKCQLLHEIHTSMFSMPITTFLILRHENNTIKLYVGTFLDALSVYDFETYEALKPIPVDSSVECMEARWGMIFIACADGWLYRYSISLGCKEFEEKFNDGTVVSMKAHVEGPRRILLMATRNSPLYIRDAMTGLQLRVIAKEHTYGIFDMIFEGNQIFCVNNKAQLLTLSFHEGAIVHTVPIPGITKIYGKLFSKISKDRILISCNGKIYSYDMKKSKFIGEIDGPGGGIVSMEVFSNQLIIGTKTAKFKAIPIPRHKVRNSV